MRFSLVQALLLPSPQPTTPISGSPVYATLRPLVGGPSLLPIHIQIAHDDAVYDFLPQSPTAFTTTTTLIRGGAVDGDIRIRPLRTLEGKSWRILGYTTRSSEQLREFAEACDPRLSLASNNCWTFAAKLARYAILDKG